MSTKNIIKMEIKGVKKGILFLEIQILLRKDKGDKQMESLWRKQTGMIKSSEAFSEELDKTWEVIVIGAGMAGLLTAYYLKQAGKDVLVLEAGEIASGQTGRTTAKITSQHDLKYSKLIKQVGRKKAELYARANEAAIAGYEKLIQEENIDCQFERTDAYLYTLQSENALTEEAWAARELGIDAFLTKETELPFEVKGALCFRNQAQFSPLEFAKYLAGRLQILEHTKVMRIKGKSVFTIDRIFKADKIVVATHYPMKNVPGFYFLRQHQERSYVLALSGCKKMQGMYIGIEENGLSFRQAGDFLLLGGGGHRTGKMKPGGAYAFLECAKEKYFPEAEEVARWSAQDSMPHDGIPFIGKYSIFTPNLYVATGFQKWGMSTSMVAAMILRDELCGVKSPYREVFSPQRLHVRAGFRDFIIDAGESVLGLARGVLHLKGPRCSHMGCELVWNPDEHSWDCPCHGSRYKKDGELLDNPSTKSLRTK